MGSIPGVFENAGLTTFDSMFGDPKAERRIGNFEYWKSGFFHICVTDPNIEELCKRISDSGGKQRSRIWDVVPDKGYKIAFCEDPFGNVMEIYTYSYEQTVASI